MGASSSRASRRHHRSERDGNPAPTNSVKNGGCVNRNEVATRTTSFAPNAQNLNIVDTTLSVVGGDVHNYYNYHYHSERRTDIWVVLQGIPNFRKIYQDILSKTTPGTGMWLVKGEKFRLWLDPNGDIKIFWGSGIPGAGKTMLAAIVIARLEALCKASEPQAPICVCYVFFRYSERGEITVRSVLKVLVKQTLERHPGCVALVEKAYAQHIREDTEPSEAELLGLLGELSRGMAATFYVLDALDEAPVKIQLAVVRALASLNVKLFITSRPLKAVQSQFPEAYNLDVMAQDEDIDLHIAREIDQSTDLQTLLQQAGPIFREEIASTIKTNCGGMFLHASLQVEALSECTSARSVRRMLKEFPPKIEDVYLQTWHRICGQSPDSVSLAKTVLVWVINASRSMTVDELELAMATCPDHFKLELDQVVPGTTLISLCRGLVVVEEKSKLVRLIHYTAKDPLQQLLRSSHPCPHPLLAAVCMTHLVGSGFLQTSLGSEEEYTSTISNDPLLAYAADSWAFHAQRCIEVSVSRERIASFVSSIRAFPALTSFDRLGYFDTLSPLHVVGLFGLPLDLLSDIGDPNIRTCLRRQTPLIVAARSGHETLVRFLLALPDIEVNLVGADGFSALMRATRVGHKAIAVLLLGHPNIEINLVDLNGWSAVMLAARHGQPEMLSLLLARPEVQPNLLNNHGLSALMLASYAGHEDGVTLLLARDDVSINQLDEKGMSALMLAAQHGHGGVASLLLGRPDAQVNLVDDQGHSALMLTAEHGWEDIVALLLKKEDIKVNQQDQHGWSALMKAARFGFEGVVALLLAHPDIKNGINLINQEGLSASMIARSSGHPGISQNILENGGLSVDPRTSPAVEIGDDAPIIEDSVGFESCHTVGRRRRRRVRRLALGGGYGTD